MELFQLAPPVLVVSSAAPLLKKRRMEFRSDLKKCKHGEMRTGNQSKLTSKIFCGYGIVIQSFFTLIIKMAIFKVDGTHRTVPIDLLMTVILQTWVLQPIQHICKTTVL